MKKYGLTFPDKIFGLESDLLLLFVNPLLLILGILFLYNLFLKPQLAVIGDNFAEIKKTETLVISTRAKRDYLLSISEEELEKNVDLVKNAVLGQKDSYYLVGLVRNIANKHAFRVESFSINPGKIDDDDDDDDDSKLTEAVQLPVTLTLVGVKDKYLDLIQAMESSLPVLTFKKFDMKGIGSIVELKLVITAYYIPDQKEATISNLSLSDVKLVGNELEMLRTISEFTKTESGGRLTKSETETQYRQGEYLRTNPFTL
jgi:hypothetical protein